MTGKGAEPAGRNPWKGCYGKEPFDLRLVMLRMFYRLPMIALATFLGTLFFGGGYYVRNVLLRGVPVYEVTSVFRVEYAADRAEELAQIYINEMTWNTYIHSGMFLDKVRARLPEGAALSNQELAGSMRAILRSDLRVPAIVVATGDPGRSEGIARAAEAVMTRELDFQEIRSISVVDPGIAQEVIPDVRPVRALVLGAVLSCFFAVVILLLKETGDDAIWLPGSVWRRYGVRCAGTLESRELAANLRYFFREREGRVAVCMAHAGEKAEDCLGKLREKCPGIVDASWFAAASPLEDPESSDILREAGGILLAVCAGSHAGRKLEAALEYLWQQDCEVTAAVLWEADEKLLRRYYFGRSGGSGTL